LARCVGAWDGDGEMGEDEEVRSRWISGSGKSIRMDFPFVGALREKGFGLWMTQHPEMVRVRVTCTRPITVGGFVRPWASAFRLRLDILIAVTNRE